MVHHSGYILPLRNDFLPTVRQLHMVETQYSMDACCLYKKSIYPYHAR